MTGQETRTDIGQEMVAGAVPAAVVHVLEVVRPSPITIPVTYAPPGKSHRLRCT